MRNLINSGIGAGLANGQMAAGWLRTGSERLRGKTDCERDDREADLKNIQGWVLHDDGALKTGNLKERLHLVKAIQKPSCCSLKPS